MLWVCPLNLLQLAYRTTRLPSGGVQIWLWCEIWWYKSSGVWEPATFYIGCVFPVYYLYFPSRYLQWGVYYSAGCWVVHFGDHITLLVTVRVKNICIQNSFIVCSVKREAIKICRLQIIMGLCFYVLENKAMRDLQWHAPKMCLHKPSAPLRFLIHLKFWNILALKCDLWKQRKAVDLNTCETSTKWFILDFEFCWIHSTEIFDRVTLCGLDSTFVIRETFCSFMAFQRVRFKPRSFIQTRFIVK